MAFRLNKMQYNSMTLPFRLLAIDYYVFDAGFRNVIQQSFICLVGWLTIVIIIYIFCSLSFSFNGYAQSGIWKSDVFASVSFLPN